MPLNTTYSVLMSDGRELTVSSDQRDWAAMEAQEFPEAAIATRARYFAFNSMKRAGLYNGRWDRFNDVDCVEVQAIDDEPAAEDTEDGQGLDPGPQGTPDVSTSRSPAKRAARSRRSSGGTRGTSTPTSS